MTRPFGTLSNMEREDVPTLRGLLERAAAEFPSAGVAFEDDRQTYAELLASATAPSTSGPCTAQL
jgi:hypothetical protein